MGKPVDLNLQHHISSHLSTLKQQSLNFSRRSKSAMCS
ncbi:flavin oxidoreductase nadh oxidase family protein [Moniliophthora roreri]|nr:flavin oxidoreductase nadh oxidase family protein [Moniliophthora roreri]